MNVERVRGWMIAVVIAGHAVALAASDRPLVEAVKNQDKSAVRALLDERADVNAPQPDGATALHWAVHHDDLEVVGWLLEAGAHVDVANDYGVTPLSLASGNGRESVVRMLLVAGADLNGALPSGETVLMTAANTGQVDVVRILLARGARVDATETSRGQTALMWALSETHLDAAQALIAHGANVNARATSGFTPLMFAARQGDLEASRMLLARGADIHGAAEDGTTALLTATVRGYPDLVRLLLAEGADPNASGAGYTALHWAAGSWETELTGEFGLAAPTSKWAVLAGLTGEAKLDLVRTLLAHGADPDVRTTRRVPRFGFSSGSSSPQFYGTLGATPFLLAAQAGDATVMRALVAAGADPLIPTDANTTPLMQATGISRVIGESHATEAGSLEAVKLAVELGADINAVDDAGNTALHGAATQGADTVVQFLVDHGAELDVRNAYGETPWMIVAGFGLRRGGVNIDHPITAELLRALGADTSH